MFARILSNVYYLSVIDEDIFVSYVAQVNQIDPRNKSVHETVPKSWGAVCDFIKARPDFYQAGTNLTYRKIQDRYEKLEKDFSSLYLNPGTNASDRQVLMPLQVTLKKTAEAKELAAARSKESAKAKVDQKKYLGKIEDQFRMHGPSPTKVGDTSATISPLSDDEENDLTI